MKNMLPHGEKTYKHIIEKIISLIVSGELKTGDKLPGERVLAEKFSISRSSIREAFRTLEILGIIEVRHGGGTFVREFHLSPFLNTIAPLFLKNVDILGEMMDFRILIEEEAVKAAAKSRNSVMIEQMKENIKQMKNGDSKTAERADIDFRMSIFTATDNRVLTLAGESLSYIMNTSIHTSREKLLNDEKYKKNLLNEHERILKAIESSNPENAGTALRRHLEGVRNHIIENIEKER